jgi:threonine efflux protein
MHYVSILFGIATVQLLAAASPGPTFIIVSRYSIGESRRRGLLVVVGVLAADLIWAIMVASGLSVVILRYPAAYTVLQIAGAAYLIWLGGRILLSAMRKQDGAPVESGATSTSARQAVRDGFLANMINPKSMAYYTSLFVVMIPQEPPVWLFAAVVATALLVSAVWWIVVALFFTVPPVRRVYERARRSIEAVMGGVLVCLGLRMALSR